MKLYLNYKEIMRFWDFVDKPNKKECRLWLGSLNIDGYGQFWLNKTTKRASRVMWTIFNGRIPKGLLICHRCDNLQCVELAHLFIGTPSDNVQDMHKKGRASQKNKAQGEAVGRSKLKNNQIEAIRQLKGTLSERAIAKLYNVNHGTIGAIHRNKTWRKIK